MKLDVSWNADTRIARDACKQAVSVCAVALVGFLVPQHIANPELSQSLLHGFEA